MAAAGDLHTLGQQRLTLPRCESGPVREISPWRLTTRCHGGVDRFRQALQYAAHLARRARGEPASRATSP